jgi:hypothetical protein
MSVLGHSRPNHSAPVPTNVRCYSKSGQMRYGWIVRLVPIGDIAR